MKNLEKKENMLSKMKKENMPFFFKDENLPFFCVEFAYSGPKLVPICIVFLKSIAIIYRTSDFMHIEKYIFYITQTYDIQRKNSTSTFYLIKLHHIKS